MERRAAAPARARAPGGAAELTMPDVMINYKVKRDQIAHHLELLRAVYDELEAIQLKDLRWTTFRLDDDVSFVDLVAGNGPPGRLSQLPAFRRYRTTLDERCDEPPVLTELHAVHSFGFAEEPPPADRQPR